MFVRTGLLEGVYMLTASVLRYGDSNNPLGSMNKYCHLYVLGRPKERSGGWAG